MRVIFVDVACQKLKLLGRIGRKLKHICHKHKDIRVVLFGLHQLPIANRRVIIKAMALSNEVSICFTVATTGGIEVQEWINHCHQPITSICVISDRADLRPVQEYAVPMNTLLLRWNVAKMLHKLYINPMTKQICGNQRLLF